jgi:hypothetical protein
MKKPPSSEEEGGGFQVFKLPTYSFTGSYLINGF